MDTCPGCGAQIPLTRLGTGICEPCNLLRLNDMVCDVMGYERGRWIPLRAAARTDVDGEEGGE